MHVARAGGRTGGRADAIFIPTSHDVRGKSMSHLLAPSLLAQERWDFLHLRGPAVALVTKTCISHYGCSSSTQQKQSPTHIRSRESNQCRSSSWKIGLHWLSKRLAACLSRESRPPPRSPKASRRVQCSPHCPANLQALDPAVRRNRGLLSG